MPRSVRIRIDCCGKERVGLEGRKVFLCTTSRLFTAGLIHLSDLSLSNVDDVSTVSWIKILMLTTFYENKPKNGKCHRGKCHYLRFY